MKRLGRQPGVKLFVRQQAIVEAIARACQQTRNTGIGRMILISGPDGSGRSTTLKAAGKHLRERNDAILIVGGSVSASGYQPWRTFEMAAAKATDEAKVVAEQIQIVAGLGKDIGLVAAFAANPFLGIMAHLIALAPTALGLRHTLLKGQLAHLDRMQLPETLKRLIRAESLKQPVLLLLDDVDGAIGPWIVDFFDVVVEELAVDLPAVIVATTSSLIDHPGFEEESALSTFAHRALSRKLADLHHLDTISNSDMEKWLGPLEPGLLKTLVSLTGGNVGFVASLWADWTTTGAIVRSTDGKFRLTEMLKPEAAQVAHDLVKYTIRQLAPPDKADRVADMLRCGALEGKRFTVDAIAGALSRPTVQVRADADSLSRKPGRPVAILEPDEPVAVRDVLRGDGTLERYRFAADVVWYVLRRYMGREERTALSLRLAQALIAAYRSREELVLRVVAELYSVAGEKYATLEFQRRADYQSSRELAWADALRILQEDRSTWDRSDLYQSANRVLADAATVGHSRPAEDLLVLYTGAYQLAVAADAKSLQVSADIDAALNYHEVRDLTNADVCIERGIAMAEAIENRPALAEALFIRGQMSMGTDPGRAEEDFQRSMELAKERNLQLLESNIMFARVTRDLYKYKADKDKIANLRDMALDALDKRRRLGPEAHVADSLQQLGTIYNMLGIYAAAKESLTESLRIFRALGDKGSQAAVLRKLHFLGPTPADSWSLLAEGLQLAQAAHDLRLEAEIFLDMDILAERAGDKANAIRFAVLGAELLRSWKTQPDSGIDQRLAQRCHALGYTRAQADALTSQLMDQYAADRGDTLVQEAVASLSATTPP